ncbi:electron transfer flavoprotein subunit alpha/FixB family protein [bacterium]|nr:electron transfer flavoprotein subunit alpha/FixB family protein [bacterium]
MKIWVFVEETDGSPAELGLEMLTKARGLGGEVSAVYLGGTSDAAMAALGTHGAGTVYRLDPGSTLPASGAAAALEGLVGEHAPDLLLFGLAPTDRDIAGRLSARLDKPVISNAVDLEIADGGVKVVNEILGGTTRVITTYAGDGPFIAVVRPKSFAAEPGDVGVPAVVETAMPDTGHAGAGTITERHEETSEGPKLEEAEVIVAGGRGMGAADKWAVLDELAGQLGAAVGATRAVVDAGWVPYSLQIGQTGKIVKPGVYIACALSGAMQHLVGMKDSGVIIAVNKDEEAPIFGIADLGIVGDVHRVIPALVAALSARG